MRGLVLFSLSAVLVACASGSGRSSSAACAPMLSDTLLSGTPVYPECGVSRAVRAIGQPPRPQYTPPAGQRCIRAVIDVVVNANGLPVPATARVVRATDAAFASAVLATLSAYRYRPAEKDGLPVAQLVRVDHALQTVVVPAAMRGAPRPRSPSC
jgi:hypothetical protein